MMAILHLIAEVIGLTVLGLVFALGLLTLGSAIHEFIRSRGLAYDRYWYDDNARWNARWKRRERCRRSDNGGRSLPHQRRSQRILA
jgi:hypothetical protein